MAQGRHLDSYAACTLKFPLVSGSKSESDVFHHNKKNLLQQVCSTHGIELRHLERRAEDAASSHS